MKLLFKSLLLLFCISLELHKVVKYMLIIIRMCPDNTKSKIVLYRIKLIDLGPISPTSVKLTDG